MSELCRVTAQPQDLTFDSAEAAKSFAEKFSTGAVGGLGLSPDKKRHELKGQLVCVGYADELRPGARPNFEGYEYCLVLRLHLAEHLKDFDINGKCILEKLPF